ncbi:cytochrome P450 [Polychytrium aggregatum]|uniref:cytochrome P450 n=1 Tax=Polychytrium aggregatum TaxID=110093 RepID=UPI0022FE9390|nr:cytochrome P450 [Polychytrium aggregatum]KAI9203846.1 cytochrome P450 [Polychytrium aggregatum]
MGHMLLPICASTLRSPLRDRGLRGLTRDLIICHLNRKTNVVLVVSHLHRNPKYWKDPNTFNPDRWSEPIVPGSFLPFGDGPMNCIGQKMANIETKVFLIRTLQRYNLKLLDPSQLRIIFSATQGYKDGVDVLVERRVQ